MTTLDHLLRPAVRVHAEADPQRRLAWRKAVLTLLWAANYPRWEIADILGMRSQHVRRLRASLQLPPRRPGRYRRGQTRYRARPTSSPEPGAAP